MWFYTYDKSPVILFTLKERCRHVSRGQQHTACVPSGNIFMRRRANWNTVHISKKLTITFVELLGNSCTLPGKKSSAILNCWTAGKVNWFEESYICFVFKVYLYKWTYVLTNESCWYFREIWSNTLAFTSLRSCHWPNTHLILKTSPGTMAPLISWLRSMTMNDYEYYNVIITFYVSYLSVFIFKLQDNLP